MSFRLIIVATSLIFVGCQEREAPRQTPSAVETAETIPLRKIHITSPSQIDSLRQRGIEPIVIEPDYVVARVSESQQQTLAAAGVSIESVQEEDLVQRLVEVLIRSPGEKDVLTELGMDIWHVAGDTVVAQAFDSQIVRARERGLELRVVERDVRNLAKQE